MISSAGSNSRSLASLDVVELIAMEFKNENPGMKKAALERVQPLESDSGISGATCGGGAARAPRQAMQGAPLTARE